MEPGITWYEVLGVLPGEAVTVHVWHPPARPGTPPARRGTQQGEP
jgi:hypothetical protein